MVGSGSGSQRLLCLNPTTVMVVSLLGFELLLGCDNCKLDMILLMSLAQLSFNLFVWVLLGWRTGDYFKLGH